jgi:hypothetical protein
MSIFSLRAAILLLPACMLTLAPAVVVHTASNVAGYTQKEPSKQQSQTTPADGPVQMIEGCLSSIDDAFLVTDENGRTYQLTGDTALLLAHAGSEVRLWGHDDSVRNAESMVAAGPIRSFNVLRARSLSSGCPTRRG